MMRLVKTNEEIITIRDGAARLEGALAVPDGAGAIVLFVHGSGSSRHSPRNNYVARVLRASNLATLLLDLLTPEEDADYETRFDMDLLVRRLTVATKWLSEDLRTRDLRIGYFGASTGAAAALRASASMGAGVGALVSRGGRVDLARDYLPLVTAPTLFIVGERDDGVLELNRECFKTLNTEKELVVVPGATHLFEEPGALETVAELAAAWFSKYLIPSV